MTDQDSRLTLIARWHQCPGCWQMIQAAPPEDGWIKCYGCGEKMTNVDLRSASPQPRGAVEALRAYGDHQSWRCAHPDRWPHDPDCPCGLLGTLVRLGGQ